MILNHLIGLYVQPKKEWQAIESNNESSQKSLSHILLIALIPAISAYLANTKIGWNPGFGEPIFLSQQSAFVMSVGIYAGLVGGVFILAYLVYWMAKTFNAKPNYTQAFELAAYTATPLFMTGISALYPELWFMMIIGLSGLTYSVYLLYTGVPILMKIPDEQGFIYASSVVTAGLVLLVGLMALTIILTSVAFTTISL